MERLLSQLKMLELKNIEVVYNEVVLVIKGLSLNVNEGEIVSLLGANGAGKSTTLKAVSGLLKSEDGEVTKGNITFLNKDITYSNPSTIVKSGLFQVMEGRRCIADMTVLENLRLGAHTRRDRKNISYDIEENKQTLTDDTPVFDKAPNGQKFTESVKEWKI